MTFQSHISKSDTRQRDWSEQSTDIAKQKANGTIRGEKNYEKENVESLAEVFKGFDTFKSD